MNMIRILNFLLIVTLFSSFSVNFSSAKELEEISTKTAVIFNTLCAKCHEGECSGRLSFDTKDRVANSHIKRYAGDTSITESETKDFFTLLNYMKKKCLLWMPNNGKWEPENLSHFALSSYHGYFIPLGILNKGKYRLTIKTEESSFFRVEVISSHFEPFLDQSISSAQKDQRLHFTIDVPVNAFLRIRSRRPLHVISLEIKKEEKNPL